MRTPVAALLLISACQGSGAQPHGPASAARLEPSSSAGRAAQGRPAIPELGAERAPVTDDGLAGSGVPGYERPGCSPLGPYEDAHLNAPGYDPTACSMSDRMAKVAVGFSCGFDDGEVTPAKPEPLRCWPLSEKEQAHSTYSSALAAWRECPKERGGHGLQLPEGAPLTVGTCADGTRFLREGSKLDGHRTRFYDGERLIGIQVYRGIGKGGACRGEVNCTVTAQEGMCRTTPAEPRNQARRPVRNPPP